MDGLKNLIFVFDRMPDHDGCMFIEVENESGESVCAGEWRNREDGLAELVIPVSYGTLAREAALREELATLWETVNNTISKLGIDCVAAQSAPGKPSDVLVAHVDAMKQRLTAAEQRNADGEAKGIELAAKWVDRRLNEYVRDHGMYDPDTGTLEFPGDGAEYAEELDFIASSIRSIKLTESGAIDKCASDGGTCGLGGHCGECPRTESGVTE